MKIFSYDYKLKDLLTGKRGEARGAVHSVFSSSVNVELRGVRVLNGCLVTFYTSTFNQPGTVVADRIPAGMNPGDEFRAGLKGIILRNQPFDFSAANPWREKFPDRGAAGKFPQNTDGFRKRKTAALRKIFGSGCKIRAKSFEGKSIKDIVGVGEGLTPAGDDLLVGALNSAFYEKKIFPCAENEKKWIKLSSGIKKHLKRTNSISVSFLKYAIDGRIGERAMNLLNAVYCGTGTDEIISAAETFFQWGATSGRFYLAGLLDFVELLTEKE